MFALDEKRPGLVDAVPDGGASLDLEVSADPETEAGSFLACIPSPLGLGRVLLDDSTDVCGFLCEQIATRENPTSAEHGGWRAWLQVRAGKEPPKE